MVAALWCEVLPCPSWRPCTMNLLVACPLQVTTMHRTQVFANVSPGNNMLAMMPGGGGQGLVRMSNNSGQPMAMRQPG